MGLCLSDMDKETAEALGAFIQADDAENMGRILDKKSLSVESNLHGRQLLQLTAGLGSVNCVGELLARGACVNQALNDGDTPLLLAAGRRKFQQSFPEVVCVGSETKRVPAPKPASADSPSRQDSTGKAVADDERDDDVIRGDICRLLLEFGADFWAVDRLGRSAMHVAAEEGQVSATVVLVERCRALLQLRDKSGATPLFLACRAGHWAVAACHLMEGCDVDAVVTTAGATPTQESALHSALTRHHDSVVVLLCSEGADVNLPMPGGRSPLHHAVRFSSLAVVSSILQAGADVDALDPNGATPLFQALRTGELQLLDRLPRRTAITASGRLSVSEERENTVKAVLESVRLLLEAGARLNQDCAPGKTALRVSLEYEMETVATLLIQHGAAADWEDIFNLILDVVVKKSVDMAPVLVMLSQLSQHSWGEVRLCAMHALEAWSWQELSSRWSEHPDLACMSLDLSELPSLQMMCRGVIRQTICSDWNISLYPAVNLLPLPQRIKDYLMMQEWNPKDSQV